MLVNFLTVSSESNMPSLGSLQPYASTICNLFINLMLLNYLAHGINIQQSESYSKPDDLLSSLFEGSFSDDTLRDTHVATYLSAGLAGALRLSMQGYSMVSGGGTPPASASSLPTTAI